jgi:polyhydroxyalkanoate synthesis regulator protein
MQSFLPSYLEMSLAAFTQQQDRLRGQLGALGNTSGLGPFDEQVRQNLALFDRAMKMFSPFAFNPAARPEDTAPPKAEPAAPTAASEDALADLRKRLEEMQAQIEKLAKR